jgi:hypothetical protein
MTYNFTQVMSHTQKLAHEPMNRSYPDQTDMGAYCAWPWGISLLIDGLEQVGKHSRIDSFTFGSIRLFICRSDGLVCLCF